jgi:hypothetical protein
VPWRSLVELVGDQHGRATPCREIAHHAQQLLRLPRRQDGGRLVEQQDVRVRGQRFHDLEALLERDREPARTRIRVER